MAAADDVTAELLKVDGGGPEGHLDLKCGHFLIKGEEIGMGALCFLLSGSITIFGHPRKLR